MLPACKVTPEIAAMRGVPEGKDCVSPPRHSAFSDVGGLIEFVERIADATGLPVGIKSAVGDQRFWAELAARMAATGTGPDFITIDGGEGGTGRRAARVRRPRGDAVQARLLPVFGTFAEAGIADDVVFIGAGRLGFPEQALFAFALGCDMVNVGREAMMAVGCIQAQRCHTGRCPTGVATQSRWLMRGLDPELKSARAANYVRALRGEMLSLSRACGVPHPGLLTPEHLEIVSGRYGAATVGEVFAYEPAWRQPTPERERELRGLIGTGSSDVDQVDAGESGPVAGDGTGDTGDRDSSISSAEAGAGMAGGGD
jgi:glutamate synthase domain-containing protein 2